VGRTPLVQREYVRKDGTRLPVLMGAAMVDSARERCLAFLLDQTERREVEAKAARSRAMLDEKLAELSARSRQSELLNELTSTLQSLSTLAEMHDVVAHYAQRLFPSVSGVLHVKSASRTHVEKVVSWGPRPRARASSSRATAGRCAWAAPG
jgi:hypothetical protein